MFGGGRVPKDDERVDAYGELDKLNAASRLMTSSVHGNSESTSPLREPHASSNSHTNSKRLSLRGRGTLDGANLPRVPW